MRLLLSCKEQSNSFRLALFDYFWSKRVTKDNGGKEENENNNTIFGNPDIFSNIQKHLPPPEKSSLTEAPSANPSSPTARGGGNNSPKR